MGEFTGRLYVPMDVHLDDDDRVIEAGERAMSLYLWGLRLAKKSALDGVILRSHLRRFPYGATEPRTKSLLTVGLWEEVPEGYYITGWLKWNKPAADMMRKRSAASDAGALGNHRRWHADGNKSQRCPYCVAGCDSAVSEDGSQTRSQEGSLTRSGTRSPTRSGPIRDPNRVRIAKTESKTETESKTISGGSSPPRRTTDPLARKAWELTQLAFEQPEKPVLRSDGDPFAATLGVIEQVLRSGTPVGDVEWAIVQGVEVWTLAGLRTAVAKTRHRSATRDGASAVLDELEEEFRGVV
jgi:hypothetical protein